MAAASAAISAALSRSGWSAGDVRQQHLGRQRHDEEDGDGPHAAVRGLPADPADDREQHPQQLVLPTGGRDDDGDAARHRHGEEQLPVTRVAHRTPESHEGDGRAERQEEADLQRPAEAEPKQRAVQRLVGEVVGVLAEADTRQMVHPVGVRVVRHHGPGQPGEGREGGRGGRGGTAAPGEPEQRREEQHRRLERRREPDEDPAGTLPTDGETAEQDQQDRDDTGLTEVEGVAHGERQHQQADGDGRREQRRTPTDGGRQGAGRDQAEGDDQQQGAEGPAPAEGLFGRPGEGFEDESAERGAGEPRRVVQRALHMQYAVGADPGLQIRQPVRLGRTEDGGHLAYGEYRGDRPEPDTECAQPCSRGLRRPHESVTRSSAVLHVRHALSASRPIDPCVFRTSHTSVHIRTLWGAHHPVEGRGKPPLHLTSASVLSE